jgi:hypothetical protein
MANTDNDVSEVLQALRDREGGYQRAWDIVWSWDEQSDAALRELCLALTDRIRPDRNLRSYVEDRRQGLSYETQMFDHLTRGFADTPGGDAASILIDICQRLAARGADNSVRQIVYWMAPTHSVVDVLDIFRRSNHVDPQELWTVLLHEYIANGEDLSDDETVTRYLASVKESGHRLGTLPAKLVEGEWPSGESYSMDVVEEPPRPAFHESPRQPDIERLFERAVVITKPSERRALTAPYRLWLEAEMNARVDVAVVLFDRQIGVGDVEPDSLHRLSIDSMSGAIPPILRRVPLPVACSELQSHASRGGSYLHGLGQAYGRLAKWQCVAALAEVPEFDRTYPKDMPPDIIATVMHAAEACAWWTFRDTRWFLVPDFLDGGGFAVLRPDGRTLAVVASADCD